MSRDFLFEIGCEEIPSHAQKTLSSALRDQFTQALTENNLKFNEIKSFATPRRLAILIEGLETVQAPQTIERQGPPVQGAYDKNGTPTLVCLGFAKSCGVSVDQLTVKETPKGKRIVCICEKPGTETKALLPEIVSKIVSKLPISKPMRWGSKSTAFIRPVHWVVMLFGEDIIDCDVFGIKTSRETFGHRFHHPKPIRIAKPADYTMLLYTQGFVIADYEARKKVILKSVSTSVTHPNQVVVDEDLLEEVTGLVEWPVVLKGTFDPAFLSVPKECLITSMQTNQKCFPVVDPNNNLQPYFILVSNIVSKEQSVVIKGNERVIHARLSDAAFFYQQDIKQKLIDRRPKLDSIIFQDHLGSIGDKVNRVTALSTYLANQLNENVDTVSRAATLSKCDLVTDMVLEFPNLQGTVGYYYALHNQETNDCALAIRDQYHPRFSGDSLPETVAGCCLALADRIDTLVGILGTNNTPTGDKDPFALRRAAHGIVRILIEKQCDIDLHNLIQESQKTHSDLPNKTVVKETFDFIMTRLKSWYTEQGVAVEVFESVHACEPTSLTDFNQRLQAVLQFQTLPEATSLAAANKRVSNILKKQDNINVTQTDSALFEFDAERTLSELLKERSELVNTLYEKRNYEKALTELSTLKEPIDAFFDSVMIMVDDEQKKQNRLALLFSIRTLFTKVADISLLP